MIQKYKYVSLPWETRDLICEWQFINATSYIFGPILSLRLFPPAVCTSTYIAWDVTKLCSANFCKDKSLPLHESSSF